MYFATDAAGVDKQPSRELAFRTGNLLPLLYYAAFLIFGTLFATNIFVGVMIQSFQQTKREIEGSAVLTEEQLRWINTLKLIYQIQPEISEVIEPEGSNVSGARGLNPAACEVGRIR